MITISWKHTTIEIRPGLISPWQTSFLLIRFFILLRVLINLTQQRDHSCSIALPISNRKRFHSVSFSMDSLPNQLPWRIKRPRGTREVKLWRKQESDWSKLLWKPQKKQEEKAAWSCKQWLAAREISKYVAVTAVWSELGDILTFKEERRAALKALLGGHRILFLPRV